jgi:hypothetical protein
MNFLWVMIIFMVDNKSCNNIYCVHGKFYCMMYDEIFMTDDKIYDNDLLYVYNKIYCMWKFLWSMMLLELRS